MNTPIIKKLVETQSLEELQHAEVALLEGKTPAFAVEGKDEGEQLIHVLAAIEIHRYMRKYNAAFVEALRHYTQRVKSSIS